MEADTLANGKMKPSIALLCGSDLVASPNEELLCTLRRMIFAYEGYAPKLVSHGENFKLQPGETLVMNCKFTDMSGLSRK